MAGATAGVGISEAFNIIYIIFGLIAGIALLAIFMLSAIDAATGAIETEVSNSAPFTWSEFEEKSSVKVPSSHSRFFVMRSDRFSFRIFVDSSFLRDLPSSASTSCFML